MPNARSKGKVKTTFWLTKRQRSTLELLAQDEGLNMTEMVQEMIDAYASHRGIRIASPEVEGAKKTRKENTER